MDGRLFARLFTPRPIVFCLEIFVDFLGVVATVVLGVVDLIPLPKDGGLLNLKSGFVDLLGDSVVGNVGGTVSSPSSSICVNGVSSVTSVVVVNSLALSSWSSSLFVVDVARERVDDGRIPGLYLLDALGNAELPPTRLAGLAEDPLIEEGPRRLAV